MSVGYDRPQKAFSAVSAAGGAGTPTPVYFGSTANPSDYPGYLFDIVELWVRSTGTGGAGSPTLDCKLQCTFDGTNWVDCNIAITQITAGTATTVVSVGKRGELAKGAAAAGNLVILGVAYRALFTAGSASGTETFTGTVGLVCRSQGT